MSERILPQHNYVVKIQAMWQTGALPREVGFHQVRVYHDDFCGVWQQQRCNCEPDIRLTCSLPGSTN